MIELGDFIGQMCPNKSNIIKKGIVIESLPDSYVVQWLTYDKTFWMEFQHPVFEELNRSYLLTKMSIHRKNSEVDITILNKAGYYGVGEA
tara:strand:+ start:3085 stop:3354 length:270 start_codon:yes stop_codon:yes gene_type:complete